MLSSVDQFTFEYEGSDIVYGRACIDRLGDILDDRELGDALVVCGSNVGANDAVMDPVSNGLGDRLVGVFDGTTPAKQAETVYEGIELMAELEPDVLVGVGGGSSLDIARQMSVFAADERTLADLRSLAREEQLESPSPDGSLTPVAVVPTTFAGADISAGGSVEVLPAAESPTGQPVRISGRVWPDVMLYDPALFETTPMSSLAGSAMNGFDKGIETIYVENATPITDATATRGLQYLTSALPTLPDGSGAIDRAVLGTILVQFERQTSIVHAFGHGFARRYPVQQGNIHAVVVPHVLRYVFEKVDGRRDTLAAGFEIETTGRSDSDIAGKIIEQVGAVRDSLDLPTRLRDLDPVRKDDLPDIATFIHEDTAMEHLPENLNPTINEIETVLYEAW